jgi:hypothetical protein
MDTMDPFIERYWSKLCNGFSSEWWVAFTPTAARIVTWESNRLSSVNLNHFCYASFLMTFNFFWCRKKLFRIFSFWLCFTVCKVLVGRAGGKRPQRRPRSMWEDNMKMHLREIWWGNIDWIRLAQDMDQWRALVNTVMNFLLEISKWVGIATGYGLDDWEVGVRVR